jgi:hypothetical protein
MRTALGVRPDVRGIEDQERPLAGDGASALVGIGHQQAEQRLFEADGFETYDVDSLAPWTRFRYP